MPVLHVFALPTAEAPRLLGALRAVVAEAPGIAPAHVRVRG